MSRPLVAAVGLLFVPPDLAAQPTLTTPVHFGTTKGRRAEATLTGTNLAGVTAVRPTFPGKVEIPPRQADPAVFRVAFHIPSDTPIGPYAIRVASKDGESAARPIAVDELPEVTPNGSNHSRAKPQGIPVPCVVVGTATADAGDCYLLRVTAGRPVTVDVLARRLGSDLDPVLLFADRDGKELAGLAADDTPGLKADARVSFVPKADGEIVVEVRDTTYRGGSGFGYRLRVGDFPAVTAAFPLAVERGTPTAVGFVGPGADGVPPVTLTAPAEVAVVHAEPRRPGGLAGWPVAVRVSDHPEAVEAEPNDDPAMATRVPVPGGVSARFTMKGDRDVFVFAAKKGKKLLAKAVGAEVRLRVLGPTGTEVGASDPAKAEAAVEFAPAADGDYRAVCDSLNYAFGPGEVYHLTVGPAPVEKPAERPAEKKK